MDERILKAALTAYRLLLIQSERLLQRAGEVDRLILAKVADQELTVQQALRVQQQLLDHLEQQSKRLQGVSLIFGSDFGPEND